MKTPYPGKNESHESWVRRCDEAERQWRREQQEQWASAMRGAGLSARQKAKLGKAADKLPEGFTYEVSNDNNQIQVWGPDGMVACATRRGREISAWVADCERVILNRACAAVWGRQPLWS